MRIFMAFQEEHVSAFPKDAPSMSGYVNLIIKMKVGGMLWLCYDMLLRQKRTKKTGGPEKSRTGQSQISSCTLHSNRPG